MWHIWIFILINHWEAHSEVYFDPSFPDYFPSIWLTYTAELHPTPHNVFVPLSVVSSPMHCIAHTLTVLSRNIFTLSSSVWTLSTEGSASWIRAANLWIWSLWCLFWDRALEWYLQGLYVGSDRGFVISWKCFRTVW